MKVWFDTEFLEDGRTIDLISIGMVREDGATYYAETPTAHLLSEAPVLPLTEWLHENVIPHLHLGGAIKTRPIIATEIIRFVGPEPEFWAYYADYDWVALCQMYGRMIDLPNGWPMFCRDLKQSAVEHGIDLSVIPQPEKEHHALADAQWLAKAWRYAWNGEAP